MKKGFRKFGNVPTVTDGRKFSSKAEAKRYSELKLLERAGQIKHLQCQPKFPLSVNNRHICAYIADFQYVEGRKAVIEDVKGFRTPDYRIKAKLFMALYPDVKFVEIDA